MKDGWYRKRRQGGKRKWLAGRREMADGADGRNVEKKKGGEATRLTGMKKDMKIPKTSHLIAATSI